MPRNRVVRPRYDKNGHLARAGVCPSPAHSGRCRSEGGHGGGSRKAGRTRTKQHVTAKTAVRVPVAAGCPCRPGPRPAGGNAHHLVIGHAEGEPAVHGSEMNVLVCQKPPGRSAEQAERPRIRDIVLSFATTERSRPWPATTGLPRKSSETHPSRARWALDLREGMDRP